MSLALNEICRSYKFWNHCKLYNSEKTNYLHHSFILTSTLDVRHSHKSEKETLPWSCWFCFNINISYKCQHPCSCHYCFSSVEGLIFHLFWLDTHWWTSKIRMVGFSSEQRKKLASFADGSQSVQLINCETKQSCEGDKIEIILKEFTDIKASPRDIDICNLDPTDTSDTWPEISLDKIPKIQVFQHVTLAAKVINLSEPICVASGKRTQDFIISNCTNTTRLTVWEEDIGILHVNNSHRFEHNYSSPRFNQRRYFSKARQRSAITQIDNIADVEDFSDSDAQDDSN